MTAQQPRHTFVWRYRLSTCDGCYCYSGAWSYACLSSCGDHLPCCCTTPVCMFECTDALAGCVIPRSIVQYFVSAMSALPVLCFTRTLARTGLPCASFGMLLTCTLSPAIGLKCIQTLQRYQRLSTQRHVKPHTTHSFADRLLISAAAASVRAVNVSPASPISRMRHILSEGIEQDVPVFSSDVSAS
jgi:hypothetical protein